MFSKTPASTGAPRRWIAHARGTVLLPVILPLLGGCVWLPLGAVVRPKVGLHAVERTQAPGVLVMSSRPITEPGERGSLFVDSLIALRTRVSGRVVRVRLWNHGRVPIRIAGDDEAGSDSLLLGCSPDGRWFEMLRREHRERATLLAPGASREFEAVPAITVGSGGAISSLAGDCVGADAAARGFALRLAVEAGGARYLYTFWYRVLEAP